VPSGPHRISAVVVALLHAVAVSVAVAAVAAAVAAVAAVLAALAAENAAPVREAGADCAMKNAVARGCSNQDSGKTVAMMLLDHGGWRDRRGDKAEPDSGTFAVL